MPVQWELCIWTGCISGCAIVVGPHLWSIRSCNHICDPNISIPVHTAEEGWRRGDSATWLSIPYGLGSRPLAESANLDYPCTDSTPTPLLKSHYSTWHVTADARGSQSGSQNLRRRPLLSTSPHCRYTRLPSLLPSSTLLFSLTCPGPVLPRISIQTKHPPCLSCRNFFSQCSLGRRLASLIRGLFFPRKSY